MTTQPNSIADRLRAGDDAAFTIPLLDHSISANEIHAAELGFGVGYTHGRAGEPLPTAQLAVVAIAGSKLHGGIGAQTITHEPWWFCFGLVVGYVIGRRF